MLAPKSPAWSVPYLLRLLMMALSKTNQTMIRIRLFSKINYLFTMLIKNIVVAVEVMGCCCYEV